MDPDDESEPFSMALLGLRLSGFRNGVSRLHGTVSRGLWASAWPAQPAEEVPITSVTNGVHLPTWVSHENGQLFDRTIGTSWRDDPIRAGGWEHIHDIPDEELWRVHSWQRQRLVARARDRQRETAARHGLPASAVDTLSPEALTVGFARRFAGYKRATLLFRDPERLARIVNNADRPLQVLFAGKAHPKDEPAKHLIQEVVTQARRPEFHGRLVVLERYDVDMARSLVQGCDVWLNTPLRPLEASGTSGMKAVANGALHLSVLDGWWAEAYEPGLGWSIGRDALDDDPEVQDAFDADSLYGLLEDEILPMFYDRDGEGIPRAWVARMKASIAAHSPRFSTHRMVGEYAARAYTPAAREWAKLRSSGLAPAIALAGWLREVRDGWPGLKVLDVEDDGQERGREGRPLDVRVQAHWGGLSHERLRVEAVSGPAGPDGTLHPQAATPLHFEGISGDGICAYRGTVALEGSGRLGYAIRVTPVHPDLPETLDTGLALWA
jgi:starch phosphorylase